MAQNGNGEGGTALVTVNKGLEQLVPRLVEVLPKAMSPERYVRLAKLLYSKQPKLQSCEPITVLSSVMDAAALGLELGREAHLVPYGKQCQMLPDYRGYQKLARASGMVRIVEARVVYLADEFDYTEGTSPNIVHKPALESDRSDENVVAFYAIAFLTDETFTFIVRTPEQVERIRQKSRAKNDGPWVTDWQAMGMKTVIKELCDKRLPLTDEKLATAIELDNRYETGEITRPIASDNVAEIRAQLAAKTQEAAEKLKERLGANAETQEEPPAPGKEADELAHELEEQIKDSKMTKDLKAHFRKKLKPLWEKGDIEGMKNLGVKIEVEANKAGKKKD